MVELRLFGCKDKKSAEELSYALSQALVGWGPFKETDVIVTNPDVYDSVHICIGESNDHDVFLEVEIFEN